MGINGKQVAVLAAGYLLGRTKTIKTAVLLAGGVAYGRMTSKQGAEGESNSLMSKFSNSPELKQITSGLGEAARGAFQATASKGVESLNENLQKRSAALRGDSEDTEDEPTDSSEESEEPQETEGSEESQADSEEPEPKKATKSGGR